MTQLIIKEIQNRTDELRKEEAYRLGKIDGYKAGYNDALKESVKAIKGLEDK